MGMCMTSPRLILAGEGPTLLWTIPEVCSSVLVQAKRLLMKKGVELTNCGRNLILKTFQKGRNYS